MIKELCHDEAILSQRCEVATVEDESVAQDLIDTIKSLDDAGCLAANQIGVTKKVCVYLDDAGEPHVLYNPRLVFGLGASKMEESCLTHEEVTKSTRYIKCKVAFDQIACGNRGGRGYSSSCCGCLLWRIWNDGGSWLLLALTFVMKWLAVGGCYW